MKIQKIFNNNTVATVSSDDKEMIVTGPGIGFHKSVGDYIDERKIEKRYLIENTQKTRFYQMLENIPMEYFEFSEIIFKKASKEFKGGLSNQMVLLLTDHIAFAIQREEQGIYLPNLLLTEIQTLYQKEYRIGVWALKYIALKTGVSLPFDEAGFIAMHIINSRNHEHKNSAEEILTFSKQVLHIVEAVLHIDWKKQDFDYSRLAMHLKYLGQRIFMADKQNIVTDFNDQLYDMMLELNPEITECLRRIKDFVKHNYDYELQKQELFYIMVHILKIKH